ncbi:DNA polymerase III subunit gamma and tau, partial [Pseudokineococcus sp. 5B2Z-1]|uniref:DNA polymerase III subunit gamma and tau n=1 Tax=Pseudokineococcus sp. 5B2Z-1 TaxID=3132744 RepID=UPI0030B061F2
MAGPTLALYRRYRPESFADVIGQEHVTDPLRQALRTGRVNHAYLFSGPRGCGKTTSARILARCLNCAGPDGTAQGPTDTPCGVCPSCVELARGGPGSLDVVEIDAASHGGVDDARELRERATFAPARDRYKVFVVDEAHMVSPQGFNALLKLVEEPPEHVMFVFATTEPDKVLGTIRSRTHHYPFHLVPPEALLRYLETLCASEGVPVGKGVLPLVVRAGGGSVRDSLSVLDQLIAGADEGGVDYERAISLLGYTHASLLDDVVDALAAGDGGSVFRVVDRVVESGHDPRRFVEDLLERLRDLVVVRAVGEGARAVLRAVPDDQLARMRRQADSLGAAELSRAADVANAALTEMVGATSPRLHLELLCARLLLPVADAGERGLGARLDRLERRLGVPATGPTGVRPAPAPAAGPEPAAPPAPRGPEAVAAPAEEATARAAAGPGAAGAAEPDRDTARGSTSPGSTGPGSADPSSAGPAGPPSTDPAGPAPTRDGDGRPGGDRAPVEQPPRSAPEPERPQPGGGAGPAGGDVDTVRRMWVDVLERVSSLRRATWSLVSQHARVHEVSGGAVRLAFSSSGLADAFRRGPHGDVVRRALVDVIGLDLPVEPVVDGGGGPPEAPRGGGGPGPAATAPAAPRPGAPAPPAAPSAAPARGQDRSSRQDLSSEHDRSSEQGRGREPGQDQPREPGRDRPRSGEESQGRPAARRPEPAADEDDWPEPATPGAGRPGGAARERPATDDHGGGAPAGRETGRPADGAATGRARGAGGPVEHGASGEPERGPERQQQRGRSRGGGREDRGTAAGTPAPPADWDDLPPAEPPDDDAPPEPDDAPSRRPAADGAARATAPDRPEAAPPPRPAAEPGSSERPVAERPSSERRATERVGGAPSGARAPEASAASAQAPGPGSSAALSGAAA